MKIYLVTKNKHKFNEAKAVFSEFNVNIEQINESKYEPKDMNLEEVAKYNAQFFYEKYKKPVVIDDTGIFFKAYPNFPGNHPKLIFEILGYKGILKLLENEVREAEFKTIVAYCDKNNFKIFSGALKCIVDTKVHDLDKDVMPYERIMLYNGKSISSMTREEKNKISHRAKAFRKLAEWLYKRRNNIV